MPQFCLNVCDRNERWIDPQIYEFQNLEDARSAAIVAAREVLKCDPVDPDAIVSKQIEIADPAGHTLATVRVRDILLH